MATVQGCDCAILLFRPPPEGHTNHHIAVDLDRVSGGDGYAHAAVECCREDWTPVAIEADVSGKMVHYSELTKWTEPAKGASPRAYGRLAIRHLHRFGVMCPSFCRQVKDLLGLPYSAWRAYPVLPADLVKRMFVFLQNTHRDQPGVACLGTDDKILLSPNGIAFALGLAPASDVTGPAHELRPNLLC
jgi:hypothetical protein